MAHGWDSYFQNLPPLSSDPSTLRRTPESEGSLSQHIENFIGHDFPGTEASHEAPATNSNLNTDYYLNPSMENSSSDCLYQKYCNETSWQADGEQMEKDYLPRCGNSDISDFATDGLSSTGSFPSSFPTDLQEIRQDCGMLGTSFLEDYSDVSSCSDADVGETRPSCKFMASNSVPKPKTDVTKPSSSEWLFTDTGNMTVQTESPCPNMLKTNESLPSTSNVVAVENTVKCAQKETESPEKNVKSHTGHSQSSTTSNRVTTTGSKTVEDRKEDDSCPDQIQKEDAKRDLTQGKKSNISTSGHENSTGDGIECSDGNKKEQTPVTAQNIMATLDNEQDHSGKKVLQKEIKESVEQGNDKPNSPDCPDINMTEDEQDKSEVLKLERRGSSSLEKETFDEQASPNPNSTDGGDENMETNCEEKEIQSCTSKSRDSPDIKVSDKDATDELGKCTSTSKSNSHASDKNEQSFASQSESCLQPNSSSTAVNPGLEKEYTSTEVKTNTSPSPDPDINGPGVASDSPPIVTTDKNELSVASHIESDVNSCPEKEWISLPVKKTATSSTEPDCSDPAVTGDKKEQSVSNGLESGSQSSTSSTDINTSLEKEWTSPAEDTNETSFPNQQQSLHQSLVDQDPGSLDRDVAEHSSESSEELDTFAEKPSLLGVLYGEPLSREDSSCDADETKLDRPDSMNYTGQAPQLKSSTQMRKRLQPVVVLDTTESINGTTNSYHCTDCQHTTCNVDQLIEHHHRCHSVHNFQFCQLCNLYLIGTEQAESHLCWVPKYRYEPTSECSPAKKKKHYGGRRCFKCGLMFSRLTHYIKHMRSHTGKTPYECKACGLYFAQSSSLRRHKSVPDRCKPTRPPVTNPDPVPNPVPVIQETKAPPQKEVVWNESNPNLPQCFVKLVDISKTHPCNICGKRFVTATKAKKHFYNTHKGNIGKSTTKDVGEKTVNMENESTAKFKCPICPRLFKYSYNRARHLRDCVRNSVCGGKDKVSGKYRCPLCNMKFTLPGNRFRHIKAFCLRECVIRLAKEGPNSIEGPNSKGAVHQKQTKETEQKTQSKKIKDKKETALSAPKFVPLYKCSLCPAVFGHSSGKYRHMKKHELFKLTGKLFKYRNSIFSTMSTPSPQPSTSTTKTEDTKTEDASDNSEPPEASGSPTFSCDYCESRFHTEQSLNKHVRNHRGEKPYRCLDCGKRFKRRTHLIGHKNVHQRRIQCTVCRKILPTIGELIQHRSTHIKRGLLRCPDCLLQFQYPASLLRHLESHRKKENKAKSQDTSQPEEKPPLKPEKSLESVKETSGPKQLQCSLCKEEFENAHELRKHCLTHISGSNQCPFCKHHFNNRRYLLRHMIKHTGDKSYSCDSCGRQFYRHLYLKLHSEKCVFAQSRNPVTTESAIKTKGPHKCFYCPRTFTKKMRLKNHHSAHKANTLVLCPRCGLYFGSTKLNHHQNNNCTGPIAPNTDVSPPTANVGKSTSQTSQDVRKPPVKSAPSPDKFIFKCPHCTKRFKYRSLLLRHTVSHTGVQPYACTHCGDAFGSRTMCLQHEAFCGGGDNEEGPSKDNGAAASQSSKMPTLDDGAEASQAEDEAELKCKFCTKTFMKSRSLRRHILTHNEVNPYRCKACDSCFSRYDHLKVHQARCKGEKTRLQVCIPKISLDYVGTGWQNKIGMEPADTQETFECKACTRSFSSQSKLSRHNTMFHLAKLFKCTRCGASFAHEKSMRKHRRTVKCKRPEKEPNVPPPLENNPPSENVTSSLQGVRSTIMQRIQPYMNKKYKYTCSYCPRAFQNSWQLSVHNRLHTGERPYACNDCGLRFIRKDYVKRHAPKCPKKRHTSTPQLPESTVGQSQQPASKSPPKGFSCAYCSSRFLLFSQLQEHFLNAHKLETNVPPVSTVPLQHHLSNIPNIKKEHVDDSCDKEVSEGANVICNLDADLDSEVSKPFHCSECDMSFTNKAGLIGHQRIHTMDYPYICKNCEKGFWNKSLLRNHYRKCRRISEKSPTKEMEVPLKAEIDFVLNDSVLVFKEASESTGIGVLQTNFSCNDDFEEEGESPENSEGNQVESSLSKKKKPVQYQCSECDQSFTDGLMLISHLEDHGRQEQAKRRNACLKCGQVFANPGNLTRHMKLHETGKTYPCPDCNKVIHTASDLEIHRTCHDPTRPFGCKLCNQRFWTRPALCNHYREEHPDDVFSCRFCNKAYSVKKSLARHYRKWHKNEQKSVGRTVQEKSGTEQQPSSQVSTTGESDEDENTGTEDSDSDSAPYFPCHVCGKTFPTSETLEDHQLCHLGEKPHECAECGRCFFQANQLQQHQRMHTSEFQCQACGRGFMSLFALRKHKHTHGKSRPFRCTKCDFSFTGPMQLAEHMSTHREENFPCDICNHVFLSKSSRAEHRKSHSKSGDPPLPSISREEHEKPASLSESSSVSPKELKYRCGVCGDRFRDPEELSEHGCLSAKERQYSCSDCDKHFLHASHLKKHRASHQLSLSDIEYPCNQCSNSFSTSQSFLSHLKNHDDSAAEVKYTTDSTRGFICPVCNLHFASASGLICHFPTHPDGTFECKICKMTFPSTTKLDEHECRMTSATEFECTECGQSFLGRDAFRQHHCSKQQQHATVKAENSDPSAKAPPPAAGDDEEVDVTGEDVYNCPVCSMQFSSKSSLLEHQNKQHPNEKPFKCAQCGNTFAKRRYLREHERRHRQKITAQPSADIKFQCTKCSDDFDTLEDLSLHMRLHAEKEVGKFRCDMCYKSFNHHSHLKQHQESHVGQVVYECTECDKAFAFPHLLEKHQQTHAGSSQ